MTRFLQRVKDKLQAIRTIVIVLFSLSVKIRKSKGLAHLFVVGEPLHGNLGDHAITLTMLDFFKARFSDYQIIQIPGIYVPLIYKYAPNFFKKRVSDKDRVAISGGGFLGTLWMNEEDMVRATLKLFPNTTTIIFPQTVFFEQTEFGKDELRKTRELWQSHSDLHVLIRDHSIEFVRNELLGGNFTDVQNLPDMVLYLNRSQSKVERQGVLLCFRKDKEKLLSDDAIRSTYSVLGNLPVKQTSTLDLNGVAAEEREQKVEAKFNEFQQARLVVTDRLHGMIFAAITGTPCIALNNSSGKVEGVYSLWLKHLPYIKFVKSPAEIPELIPSLLALGGQSYDPSIFEKYWQQIANVLK